MYPPSMSLSGHGTCMEPAQIKLGMKHIVTPVQTAAHATPRETLVLALPREAGCIPAVHGSPQLQAMAATKMRTMNTAASTHAGKVAASSQQREVVSLVEDEAADEVPSAATNSTAGAGNTSRKSKQQTAGLGKRQQQQATATDPQQYFTQEELQQVRAALLTWYDSNHRVLPWRRTPQSTRTLAAPAGPHEAAAPAPDQLDAQQFAYYVWVSEIMLQQTQVATVIPYFQKWIARWPSVGALAAADVESVNEMWAGLGYYRRARYLLDGAKHVMQQLGGAFPTTAKAMLSIPGVGPYTSAAVASIAFGDPAAVVDGNVVRVLSRLRALGGDPTTQSAVHAVMAQQLLDVVRPGDFNQAVMELGARVCKPQNPECGSCPAATICQAYQQWQAYLAGGGSPDMEDAPVVTQYPGKKEAKTKKEQLVAVCVVEVICANSQQIPSSGTPGARSAVTSTAEDSMQEANDAGASIKAGKQQGKSTGSNQSVAKLSGRKRQASLFDFVAPAQPTKQARTTAAANDSKAAEGDKQAALPAAASSSSMLEPAAVAKLLADSSQRHVLLVQRPAEGLLAGLWELPSVMLEAELPHSQRKAVMDDYLKSLLSSRVTIHSGLGHEAATPAATSALTATIVRRHEAGSYVHIFSHIRQTNYVERLVLLVDDLGAFLAAFPASSRAAMTSVPDGNDAEVTAEHNGEVNARKNSDMEAGPSKEAARSQMTQKAPRKKGGQGSVVAVTRGVPPIKWVLARDLKTAGISTAPDKMYAMAVGAGSANVKGGKPAQGNRKGKVKQP